MLLERMFEPSTAICVTGRLPEGAVWQPGSVTTILLTGATDGLGRALAGRLAGAGTTLLLHGRDEAKLAAVAAELPGRAVPLRADLASLAEVRRLAAEVGAVTDRLDVLVNNAGLGGGPDDGRREVSADGYELRFAVNYLAHFLLTQLLLPLLRGSAPARVVHVASLGQQPVDFADVMLEGGYGGRRAYNQSKLAQITSGFELARRLPAAEVTVNSLHPASLMPTKLVAQGYGRTIDDLGTGVAATARLVLDPALAGVTGRFFDRQQEARADPQAYDPVARAELWKRSLDLTGAPDAP
jgi:NAD(P)-dependent dehydrogenase (short-subunit alcohol dehydrogenase family)